MRKRSMLAVVVYPMVAIVLFGPAVAIVLAFFADTARILIPVVAVASLVLAWPISWIIAPRLSASLSGRGRPPDSLRR